MKKDIASIILHKMINGNKIDPYISQMPTKLEIHYCSHGKNDNVTGIGDIIGFEPDYNN